MDEDDGIVFEESVPFAASACVQDLIALAHAHEEIRDADMRKRLLTAADQVLKLMTVTIYPTTGTPQ